MFPRESRGTRSHFFKKTSKSKIMKNLLLIISSLFIYVSVNAGNGTFQEGGLQYITANGGPIPAAKGYFLTCSPVKEAGYKQVLGNIWPALKVGQGEWRIAYSVAGDMNHGITDAGVVYQTPLAEGTLIIEWRLDADSYWQPIAKVGSNGCLNPVTGKARVATPASTPPPNAILPDEDDKYDNVKVVVVEVEKEKPGYQYPDNYQPYQQQAQPQQVVYVQQKANGVDKANLALNILNLGFNAYNAFKKTGGSSNVYYNQSQQYVQQGQKPISYVPVTYTNGNATPGRN